MNLPRLTPQSSLQACVRPGRLQGERVSHCYLRIVGQDGHLEDSVSFGPDESGGNDKKPFSPTKCQTLQSRISPESWGVIKDHYQSNCAVRGFSFLQNDCCSCAREAIGKIGLSSPEFINNANS